MINKEITEQLKAREKTIHDIYVSKRGFAVTVKPISLVDEVTSESKALDLNNFDLKASYLSNEHENMITESYGAEYQSFMLFNNQSFELLDLNYHNEIEMMLDSEIHSNFNNLKCLMTGDYIPYGSVITINDYDIEFFITTRKRKYSNTEVIHYSLSRD